MPRIVTWQEDELSVERSQVSRCEPHVAGAKRQETSYEQPCADEDDDGECDFERANRAPQPSSAGGAGHAAAGVFERARMPVRSLHGGYEAEDQSGQQCRTSG